MDVERIKIETEQRDKESEYGIWSKLVREMEDRRQERGVMEDGDRQGMEDRRME